MVSIGEISCPAMQDRRGRGSNPGATCSECEATRKYLRIKLPDELIEFALDNVSNKKVFGITADCFLQYASVRPRARGRRPRDDDVGDTSTLMDPSVFEATRASKHHREMTRFRTCLLTAGRQRASEARMAPSIGCRRYIDGLINCQPCQHRDVLTLGIAKTAGGVSSIVQLGMSSSAPERAVLVDTARSPASENQPETWARG